MTIDPGTGRYVYETDMEQEVKITEAEKQALEEVSEGSSLTVEDFLVGLLVHEAEQKALLEVGQRLQQWQQKPPSMNDVESLASDVERLLDEAVNPTPDARNIHRKLCGVVDFMKSTESPNSEVVMEELNRIEHLLPPAFSPVYDVPLGDCD